MGKGENDQGTGLNETGKAKGKGKIGNVPGVIWQREDSQRIYELR
jgi:hypothetical protein